MIETREQYRWIEGWAKRRGSGLRLSADDRIAVFQTIEALREVARAGKEIMRTAKNDTVFPMNVHVPAIRINNLDAALDKLADWLAEEGS